MNENIGWIIWNISKTFERIPIQNNFLERFQARWRYLDIGLDAAKRHETIYICFVRASSRIAYVHEQKNTRIRKNINIRLNIRLNRYKTFFSRRYMWMHWRQINSEWRHDHCLNAGLQNAARNSCLLASYVFKSKRRFEKVWIKETYVYSSISFECS